GDLGGREVTTVTGPGPSMVVASTSVDRCPCCGRTSCAQPISGIFPGVHVWRCAACGTNRAVTMVNPCPLLERPAWTVELTAARPVLWNVIILADQAPTLTADAG